MYRRLDHHRVSLTATEIRFFVLQHRQINEELEAIKTVVRVMHLTRSGRVSWFALPSEAGQH